jgi:glutamate synthase (NADPH/NADH) small chain
MPAFRYEYELAKLDGVTFHWFTHPVRIIGEGGRVASIECVRTRLEPTNGRERAKLASIPGTQFKIDVDMVVRAIGQKPVTDLFRSVPGIEVRDNGTIAVNDRYQTGARKYFAGGDCTNGGKEVVDAVAQGKAAARAIDAWLGAPRARN